MASRKQPPAPPTPLTLRDPSSLQSVVSRGQSFIPQELYDYMTELWRHNQSLQDHIQQLQKQQASVPNVSDVPSSANSVPFTPPSLSTALGLAASNAVLEDTHANRLVSYPASSYSIGQLFWETDRKVLYVVASVSATPTWVYSSGTMVTAIASRPSDLTSNDAGFQFVDSTADQETNYSWTGTEWVTTGGYLQETSDAVTVAATTVELRRHVTTGTAGVGFGLGLVDQLENASGSDVSARYQTITWTNATAGAEAADWSISLVVASVLTQALKITSAGNQLWRGKLTTYNNAAPTDGQLLIGNAGGGTFDAATLTPGTGISINNAAGAVTISLSGPFLADSIALTGQSAAIGSTNFANSSTGSTFRCSYYLEDTTADVTAGTIQLSVAFTDDAGATTVTSAALALTALGRTSGVFFIRRASGSVAYSTVLTGIIATARYALYIAFERMS